MKLSTSTALFLLHFYCICNCISSKYVSNFSSTGWVPCQESRDCETLQNATCVNGFCYCGEEEVKPYVCEENIDKIKVNSIGGECNGVSRICNPVNSVCGSKNVCVCKTGFLPSEDSKQCVKGLGGECVKSEECSSIISSSCIHSQCSCIETHVAKGSKCLHIARNVAESCEDDVQCTSLLGIGSQCSDGVCNCKTNYHYKSKDQICVKNLSLGELCESSEDCHQPGKESISQLMCIEGVCKCKLDYIEEKGYCTENNTASTKHLNLPIFLINVLLLYFYNFYVQYCNCS